MLGNLYAMKYVHKLNITKIYMEECVFTNKKLFIDYMSINSISLKCIS